MRSLVVLFLIISASAQAAENSPPSAQPPGPLACYKRLYGLSAELREGRWYLRLSQSEQLPYDDGVPKDPNDFEARLNHPDLKDQFALPYRTGPVLRESMRDHDPGRVRVTQVLRAIYAPADRQLVKVDWFAAKLRVHRRIAPALERVRARIASALAQDRSLEVWLKKPAGGYAQRPIAGTERLSPHSFGIAIDLDPKRSEYWRWDASFAKNPPQPFARPMPAAIVDAFEAEGFIWGGRWYHYDTMHFEYRPELLDPTCRP